jgi:hypothetical protein
MAPRRRSGGLDREPAFADSGQGGALAHHAPRGPPSTAE